ncbi:MAG: OmpA family protein [Mariprofundaceae bacterium]
MRRVAGLALLLLTCAMPVQLGHAAETSAFWPTEADPKQLQRDIAAFKASEDAEFAPDPIQRAEAMLGAALLARDKQDDPSFREALGAAQGKLDEARATAAAFRQQHGAVLKARRAYRDMLASLAAEAPDATEEAKPATAPEWEDAQAAGARADTMLQAAITAFGKGELNLARENAGKARTGYEHAMALLAPLLAERTEATLRRAMRDGARRLAPKTLEEARAAFGDLRAWIDGVTESAPEDPTRALRLARLCGRLTAEIRVLRKERGVLERLLRERIDERARIARSLGMKDIDPPVRVPDAATIAAAGRELRESMVTQADRCQADKNRLRQACAAEIERSLNAQKAELLAASQEQLARIKDAFRVKLERETREMRRLKKLRALFRPGEAVILARADGSLLIRLSALKFAPGKAGIARKYRDLLHRVADGLAIYADRRARIEGHTDNQGDVAYNRKLSLKRAEAVRDFLIRAGVPASRLRALGFGEVHPIASNDFAKGREMNRRIDIVIEPPSPPDGKEQP